MKKIIGIAAAALMSLSLFACDGMTKTTRTIEDVPYSNTRVVRRVDTKYKAPRALSPRNTRVHRTYRLPYVNGVDTTTNNVRNATTPYNVNN